MPYTSILGTDLISNSRQTINNNFQLAAPLVSPIFTGTPVAPTPSAADNSTKIATTAYVDSVAPPTSKNGVITRVMDVTNGVVNIAHGLGRIPKFVTITANYFSASLGQYVMSNGGYDGTNNVSIYNTGAASSGNSSSAGISLWQSPTTIGQTCVITVNITNIIFTWTKVGSPATETAQIFWQVF